MSKSFLRFVENASMRKVVVNRDEYIKSHGKAPKGRGMWMIQIGDDSSNPMQFDGTFTEALKKAKEMAKRNKKDSVKILS